MAKSEDLDSIPARHHIKSMGCLVCGRYPTDPDHIRTRGAGGMDFIRSGKLIVLNIWPLCREHHTERHAIGLDSFKAKYKACRDYLEEIKHPLK